MQNAQRTLYEGLEPLAMVAYESNSRMGLGDVVVMSQTISLKRLADAMAHIAYGSTTQYSFNEMVFHMHAFMRRMCPEADEPEAGASIDDTASTAAVDPDELGV